MNNPLQKIACVGEVMIELKASGDSARLSVAGDTYNTAVYMARALRDTGVTIAYVSALGTDAYSARIETAMRNHGLDTSCIERREGAMPGLYAIDTDANGERSFSYWRSASAARTLFTEPCGVGFDRLSGFDLVYLSGITMAILPVPVRTRILDWAEDYRAAGGWVAYDSNYRPALWESTSLAQKTTMDMWARPDIALPSIDDEMALFGDAGVTDVVARLASVGVNRGALKCGASGPLNLATNETFDGLPLPEQIVDTTAAGDSFNAAFLAALALGQSDNEAIRAGHALAIEVIGQPGAILPEA